MKKKQTTYRFLIIGIVALLSLSACKKRTKRAHNPFEKKQYTYEETVNQYATILPCINSISFPYTKQILKNHIMLCNDTFNKSKDSITLAIPHQNLPYVQYKYLLDKRIDQLKRYILYLEHTKAPTRIALREKIRLLIEQLEQLNEIIVITDEYRQEKIKLVKSETMTILTFLQFSVSTIIKKLIFL
jgi:hypothetical protein